MKEVEGKVFRGGENPEWMGFLEEREWIEEKAEKRGRVFG